MLPAAQSEYTILVPAKIPPQYKVAHAVDPLYVVHVYKVDAWSGCEVCDYEIAHWSLATLRDHVRYLRADGFVRCEW